jgi:uncharacterized protein YheU (UPF0270 family)
VARTDSGADTSVEQSVKKKNKIEDRGEAVPLFSSDIQTQDKAKMKK